MSEIVGTAGTPLEVARALKLAGWAEVPGSQALWAKAGCTPMSWGDALIVLAMQPAVVPDTRKRGMRTSEFKWAAAIILPSITAGITTLTGLLPSIPEAQRGVVGGVLLTLGAMTSTAYTLVRQIKKASDDDDTQSPKDVG